VACEQEAAGFGARAAGGSGRRRIVRGCAFPFAELRVDGRVGSAPRLRVRAGPVAAIRRGWRCCWCVGRVRRRRRSTGRRGADGSGCAVDEDILPAPDLCRADEREGVVRTLGTGSGLLVGQVRRHGRERTVLGKVEASGHSRQVNERRALQRRQLLAARQGGARQQLSANCWAGTSGFLSGLVSDRLLLHS
jgi:hypothetical protein